MSCTASILSVQDGRQTRRLAYHAFGEKAENVGTGDVTTTATVCYYFNGLRVAQQKDGVFTWLHSDHLPCLSATRTGRSATVLTDAEGVWRILRLSDAAFGKQAENSCIGSIENME